jgi:hypothetical protein
MSIWNEPTKALALTEAQRWQGVAHIDRLAKFPVGIDCIHYVAEILFAANIIERRELPFYRTTSGIAKVSTELEDRMLAAFHVEVLHVANHEPEFGDVVICATGRMTSAHCGWLAGQHLWHSLAGRCVTRSEWNHWRHKAKLFVRFYDRGWR